MILWLASFPRSGNTLLRTMLRQVFGLYSYSIHDDSRDIGSNPEVRSAVGHLSINGSHQEFYRDSMLASEFVPVKTHEPPMDQAPAIYVVRDGRAALVSYWNFLRNVRQRQDLSLANVIQGQGPKGGSWSQHIRRWAPQSRPGTLLLRYEDLAGNADATIARIASFMGRQPIAQWRGNFQQMQATFPAFFNAASDAKNIRQMTAEDRSLFWDLHGDCMRMLGYEKEGYGEQDRRSAQAAPQVL